MSMTNGKLADEMPTIAEILSTYISPEELPDPNLYATILAELSHRDTVMRDDAFYHGYGKGFEFGQRFNK